MPTKQSGKPVPGKKGKKTISRNRVAHHDYEILDTYEAGIELTGTEVKVGMHIHPYSNGGVWNVDPDRRRKMLLHRRQIDTLDGKLRTKGLALVPLEMYFDEHNRVKVQIGMGRGKKSYDKRADLAQKQVNRDIQRALKERSR